MCQEMARLHIFAPFNPELLGALSSKNFSKKKNYYSKPTFMSQEMPRMQDFAPFTPELLGALSGTPSRKDHLASEVGKPALRA
jgi:hypothetical protein